MIRISALLILIFVTPTFAQPIFNIAFGSCSDVEQPLPIMNPILRQEPDVFIYAGDATYGSGKGYEHLSERLEALSKASFFKKLFQTTSVHAVWDDHDYGINDGGSENPFKSRAQKKFLETFHVPQEDIRQKREGLYYAQTITKDDRKVQLILLDTRYFRSPLKPTPEKKKGQERYVPDMSKAKTMLGPDQWAWLKKELQKPVDFRLIVSSIQVLAMDHGFEKWNNLPQEQKKLMTLLRQSSTPFALLSGDRHYGAIYKEGDVYEITSSGLNRTLSKKYWGEKDRFHHSRPFYKENYGWIHINFARQLVRLQLRNTDGEVAREAEFSL